MTANARLQVEFKLRATTYEAAIQRRGYGDRYNRAKTPRGYCFGPGDDRSPSKEFRFLAEHIGAPGVYTSTGEYPALDKAFRTMNKEIVAAKREVFEAALLELGCSKEGIAAPGALRFSKKAGCPCGCSPGFIVSVPGVAYGETVFVNPKKED